MTKEVESLSSDHRIHLRFDKAFPVLVGSEIFGSFLGVARNLSEGGMLVETSHPLPLNTFVTVHFCMPDCRGEIAARAEVKHHYCFNYQQGEEPYATRGMGLRFTEFVSENQISEESLTRRRILH